MLGLHIAWNVVTNVRCISVIPSNTTILLKPGYKKSRIDILGQHVSVAIRPSSGPFKAKMCNFRQISLVRKIPLRTKEICRKLHILALNGPDDGRIATETCCPKISIQDFL